MRRTTPGRPFATTFALVLLIALLLATTHARADDDVDVADPDGVIDVGSIDAEDVARREARRRQHGTAPKPVPVVDDDDDDDDAVGTNEFGVDEGKTFDPSRGDADEEPQKRQKSKQQQDDHQQQQHDNGENKKKKKGGGSSRKQRYQEQQEQYRREKEDASSSSSSKPRAGGPLASKFKRERSDTLNAKVRAEFLRDELKHYNDWLAHADRWPAAPDAATADDIAALRAAAVAALPHPPVPGPELAHIRDVVAQARRRLDRLAKDVRQLGSATSASKRAANRTQQLGDPADVPAIQAATADAVAALDEIAATVAQHREFHRVLAASALASSPVALGLARGQLAAAERAMDAIRREDDAGVGATERRQRRQEVKAIHRLVKEQVQALEAARRAASSHVASPAFALDGATLETLAFKNALSRQPPPSLLETSDYAPPPTLRLLGLTVPELATLGLLTCVPFQAFRVIVMAFEGLRKLLKWGRKSSERGGIGAAKGFPPGGRKLGSTAHAQQKRAAAGGRLRELGLNFVVSVALSVAVAWFWPHASLPAFDPVTPASLLFAWRHTLAATHQAAVAGLTLWAHALQVWATV